MPELLQQFVCEAVRRWSDLPRHVFESFRTIPTVVVPGEFVEVFDQLSRQSCDFRSDVSEFQQTGG